MEMSIENIKEWAGILRTFGDEHENSFFAKLVGNWINDWDDVSLGAALSEMSKPVNAVFCTGLLVGIMSVFLMLGFKFQDAWKYIVKLFPDDFNIGNVPNHWLYREADVKAKRPDFDNVVSFHHLFKQIKETNPEYANDIRDDLLFTYLWEVGRLLMYSQGLSKPAVAMWEFRKAGSQNICEFWVKELATPETNHHNFHGQNTSQWVYAGAIVVQDGRVSSHH